MAGISTTTNPMNKDAFDYMTEEQLAQPVTFKELKMVLNSLADFEERFKLVMSHLGIEVYPNYKKWEIRDYRGLGAGRGAVDMCASEAAIKMPERRKNFLQRLFCK